MMHCGAVHLRGSLDRKTLHSPDSWIHEWFMDRQAHMNRHSSDIHSICHGSNRLPWKQSSNGCFPHGHPEFEAYPGKDHSKPQKSACPPERQDSPWIYSAITSADYSRDFGNLAATKSPWNADMPTSRDMLNIPVPRQHINEAPVQCYLYIIWWYVNLYIYIYIYIYIYYIVYITHTATLSFCRHYWDTTLLLANVSLYTFRSCSPSRWFGSSFTTWTLHSPLLNRSLPHVFRTSSADLPRC